MVVNKRLRHLQDLAARKRRNKDIPPSHEDDECKIDESSVEDNNIDEDDVWVDVVEVSPEAAGTLLLYDTTSNKALGWGHGPKTIQRQKLKYKMLAKDATKLNLKPLESFWRDVPIPQPSLIIKGFKVQQLEVVIEHISNRIAVIRNAKKSHEMLADTSLHNVFRLQALRVYFVAIKNGTGKVAASMEAAKCVGRGKNGANVIRNWSKQYFDTLTLPTIEQGRHIKTKSLIHEEDVAMRCRRFLKSIRPQDRTMAKFSEFVYDELILIVTGSIR